MIKFYDFDGDPVFIDPTRIEVIQIKDDDDDKVELRSFSGKTVTVIGKIKKIAQAIIAARENKISVNEKEMSGRLMALAKEMEK